MALLLFAGFIAVVVVLAVVSRRTGRASQGCCAPADPSDDLRMRSIGDGQDPAPRG